MADGGDTGKVGEGRLIGGHDRPVGGSGRCGDQQVVSAAWAALVANGDEELSVFDRHIGVVGDDGERLEELEGSVRWARSGARPLCERATDWR
jgi:hypothetical protein